MKRTAIRAMVGLSIAAGIVTAAGPARANVLKNYQDESKCMGVSGGSPNQGTQLIIWDCNNFKDQNWDQVSFLGSSSQLYTGAAPAPPNSSAMCASLAAGHTTNGTNLVVWTCSTGSQDQGWIPVFHHTDGNGNNCYYFENYKDNTKVFGASGGNVTNGTHIILWDYLGHNDQFWCEYPDQ